MAALHCFSNMEDFFVKGLERGKKVKSVCLNFNVYVSQ